MRRATITDEDFLRFWAKYPKRQARQDAWKAWQSLDLDADTIEQIFEALDWQVDQEDWVKADGQFCPLPATYLRGERWTDERRSGMDRRRMTEFEKARHLGLVKSRHEA